jgi:stress response protein YsnF
MLQSTRELHKFTIKATDGDVGSVDDLYFDDQSWTVRYLVLDIGKWLPGRRVLISPMSVRQSQWIERRLLVGLTRDQIERSPEIDTSQPISRQHELTHAGHYGLAPYWAGPHRWGALPYPIDPLAPGLGEPATDPEAARALRLEGLENVGPEHRESQYFHEEHGDDHLRSVEDVLGYYIQASDGDLGHVEDFLVDDWTWAIRYMIVDTRNWLPGRKVLIAPEWISHLSWAESTVHVGMTREQIRSSPEYDPSRPIDRDEELRLYEYYGRPRYWEQEDRDREDRDRAA